METLNTTQQISTRQLLNLDDVKNITGFSTTTIYTLKTEFSHDLKNAVVLHVGV